MEQALNVSQWFTAPPMSVWLLALVPGSLLCLMVAFIWRWRASTVAVLRVISLTSQAAGIPLYHRAQRQCARELARARRYQHPLTALVLNLESEARTGHQDSTIHTSRNGSSPSPVQRLLFLQLSFFLAGALLRGALRESDLVTYDAINNHYVILLTESSTSQAKQAAQRLQALIYQRTHMHWRIRIAEFPTDGLTMEALINSAKAAYNLPSRDNAASKSTDEHSP